MKILISHDVDHIAMRDHWMHDLFIQRWAAKTILYVMLGKLPVRIGLKRLALVFSGRQHRVPEVMELDRSFGIPSTFFVGMRNGLGMSYPFRAARQMVELIRNEGFAVGVHGVAYDDSQLIAEEHSRFSSIVGPHHPFGVRNHYLRFDARTPEFQKAAGFLYDSSDCGLKPPYESHGMIEFPVCLMDSLILRDSSNELSEVKRRTVEELEKGERLKLPYFTVIFHDCYYSDAFPDHQAWYRWLVQYVSDRYELIDFGRAVQELKVV
jgi:hypothetical protein